MKKSKKIARVQLRPSLRDFAQRMEATLRKHDFKKGGQRQWRGDSVAAMIARLCDEIAELMHAHAEGSSLRTSWEAIDVANFALMIHDICNPLAEDSVRVGGR